MKKKPHMFLKRIHKIIKCISEAINVHRKLYSVSINLHIVEALHESGADMQRHAVDLKL